MAPRFTRSSTFKRNESAREDEEYEKDGQSTIPYEGSFSEGTLTHSTTFRVISGVSEVVLSGLFLVLPRWMRWQRKREDISDDSEEDYDDGTPDGRKAAPMRKISRNKAILTKKEIKALRAQAEENLGFPAMGEKMHPLMRLQWNLGILQLRVYVELSKLRNEREKSRCPAAREIVEFLRFEIFIGILIALNSANMFMGAMTPPGEDDPALVGVLEHLFVFIFLVEWTLRILAYGFVWILWSPMNVFDTAIVWVTGVLVTWVLPQMGVEATLLQRISALRVLRLGRLIRAIRIIPKFRELWMLVDGMLSCFYLIFWAGMIMGIVHYVFAIFLLESVTKSGAFDDDELVMEHLGSLEKAMFTLFQIMTFDAWHVLVRQVIKKMPEALILFGLFIAIAGIVLVNLMTAIVIHNALVEAPKRDEEASAYRAELERRNWELSLRKTFDELDEDGSGKLTAQEFEVLLDDNRFGKTMLKLDVDVEELPDIFSILDDGHGEINVENFVTGLMRMQGPALARDMLKSSKRLKVGAESFRHLQEAIVINGTTPLTRAIDNLDIVHEDFTKMQLLMKKHIDQLNAIGMRRTFNATKGELKSVRNVKLPHAQAMDKEALIAKNSNKPAHELLRQLPKLTVDEGCHFKRLPCSWTWQYQKNKVARLAEERAEMEVVEHKDKGAHHAEEVEVARGIPQEFGETWGEFGLNVPDVRSMTLQQVVKYVKGGRLQAFTSPKAFHSAEVAMSEQTSATPTSVKSTSVPVGGLAASLRAAAEADAPAPLPPPADSAQPGDVPTAPPTPSQAAVPRKSSSSVPPADALAAGDVEAAAAAAAAADAALARPTLLWPPRDFKVLHGLANSLVVPSPTGVFLPPLVEEHEPDAPPSHQLTVMSRVDIRDLPNLPNSVGSDYDMESESDES